MTNLLISALLPLVVATTCPEGSDSCPSGSQALLQSSMSHQIGMDDASEGGLGPLLLMLRQGGERWGRGDGHGLEDSSKSGHIFGQLETHVEAAALEDKPLSPLEESLMKALHETLENTTLPSLRKGHEDDQKEMNRTVQALVDCNSNFATDFKSAASAKQAVDAKQNAHQRCRGDESKLKSVHSEKLKDLKKFIDELQQPVKPLSLEPTAAESYFAAGLQWFRDNQAIYTQKNAAYTAAQEAHANMTDACNYAQTSYESGYCQWIGQATAASKSYTRCWKEGGGNDWNQTRATILNSAEQRKHGYVAVKKIQCFLSSLSVLSSKTGVVTQRNISVCKALTPDTTIFDLINSDAPPTKNLTTLGDLKFMPGDGVWQKTEYANISDEQNVTPCAKAVDDNNESVWKDGNMSHYCNVDEKVLMHRCLACEAGRSNARDDALGRDTNCSAIICDTDEHVVSNSCTSCSPGKVRLGGDDASGADTACKHVICKANQCVQGNECIACDPGKTRGAGDKASGTNTSCSSIFCDAGQFVRSHGCHSCPAGHKNDKGDDASGLDTSCEAIKCGSNEHVKKNTCHTCPPGTTNTPGDDASKGDTSCDATKCAKNTKVVSNECKGCPPGKTNAANDDASAGDTQCDAKYCPANQYVVNHACTTCPDGTTRPAGDDASGTDTSCRPITCQANQRVKGHACEACPHGTVNAVGDDASGHDTSCDRTCALHGCPSGYKTVNSQSTSLSMKNCCEAHRWMWTGEMEHNNRRCSNYHVHGRWTRKQVATRSVEECAAVCARDSEALGRKCDYFSSWDGGCMYNPHGCRLENWRGWSVYRAKVWSGTLIHGSRQDRRCANYHVNGRWTRKQAATRTVEECAAVCARDSAAVGRKCDYFSSWDGGCLYNPYGCRIEIWRGWTLYKATFKLV
eukprot:TRINITY_DN1733_c0_g1_i1.p1 TRINITY_DN1733_c0_g1~~TRINITY_DN1733_c0_g1_i1.p1  ORF type:complete len:914 (+),score=156.65 TRINITY_DN1733_c0_g1_i1:70-2811(+)